MGRTPIATVGMLWSQRNMDFFGRDDAGDLVDGPWNGLAQALVHARIPAVPVHVDDVERVTRELGIKLLVLPDLAALSDSQVAAIRRFVTAGGGLLATGMSSLCDEAGRVRTDLALGDLFGVGMPRGHSWRDPAICAIQAREWSQTYLRLPSDISQRHESLRDFAETDILAFGGTLALLDLAQPRGAALTYVPALPLSPPEDVWMRESQTGIPGLICSTHGHAGARVAYLPADLDRRFARDQLPDHGDLLAALARWYLHDDVPVALDAPGLIDCRPWRTRAGEIVVHLLNLNNANTWRTPVQDLVPTGPLRLKVRMKEAANARALVSEGRLAISRRGDWCEVEIPRLLDHEVIVFAR